ncbi:MAG: NUDIX hydrolase [Deltaproteobacteria bacterium]|nr:MAG: NUDIX hydrolase [Deltaproteobacteria bacterium]
MSLPGRLVDLAALVPQHLRTAWWGLVSPRLSERGPVVVVQAVIRDEGGRVLLALRSDPRGLELPGGHPEPGEEELAALRREVEEETGLRVEVVRPVGVFRRTGFRPHEARVHLCRPRGGRLRSSRESPRLGWFDPAAPPRELLPWCRLPLREALAGGGPVCRVEHQGLRAVLETLRIDLRLRLRGGAPPSAEP